MSDTTGVNQYLSTSWGQKVDDLPVHTVTTGNSVPNASKSGTFLAASQDRKGYLSGNGTLLIGPHAGTSLVEWALKYAAHGYYVFPLREGSKFPLKNCQACDDRGDYYERDKHQDGDCTVHGGSSTCHGHKAATRDEATIRGWWLLHPFCNIGINVGRSGIAVLDVDTRAKEDGTYKVGESTIAALQETHGALPAGPRVTTWSGGWQRYLIHPQGVVIKSSAGSDTHMTGVGQDVDIKALSAYAVAPPSLVTGKRDNIVQGQYTWATPAWDALPDMPAWITQVIKEREASKRPARTYSQRPWSTDPAPGADVRDRVQQLADSVANTAEGARNKTLNDNAFMAFQYAAAGQVDPDEVEFIFTQAGSAADPRDTAQVERTVASARNGAANKPYTWRTRGNTPPQTHAADGATREGQDVTSTIPEQRADEERIDGSIVIASPNAPYDVARDLQRMYWMEAGRTTLLNWRGEWLRWNGSAWKKVSGDDHEADLYEKLDVSCYIKVSKDGTTEVLPWTPKTSRVRDAESALRALVNLLDTTEPNTWTEDNGVTCDVVPCKNGLLRLDDRTVLPHTPAYFNHNALPFAYVPDATCPMWEAWLKETFAHDPKAILVLQEWYGYVLSGRIDQEKALQIIGPSRSGKGVIARILEALVGVGNYCGPTMGTLVKDYGLWTMTDKTLAVIGDARLAKKGTGEIVERLLSIISGDTLSVDRKYQKAWEGRIPARLMLLANIVPNFGDPGGAMAGRFISITTQVSHADNPDKGLRARLLSEAPGILNWALDGLDRLNRQGTFTVSECGAEIKQMQKSGESPLRDFLDEMCELEAVPLDGEFQNFVLKSELRKQWVLWCATKGYGGEVGPTENDVSFSFKLKAAAPTVVTNKKKRTVPGGKQDPVFFGIKLVSRVYGT